MSSYLMLVPESLDKSISTVLAISSAALGLWAHQRALSKEKAESAKEQARIAYEAKQQYADTVKKEYAAQRDFGHIQRDIAQLKTNIVRLNEESDERLDKLERQTEKLLGAVGTLKDMIRAREK